MAAKWYEQKPPIVSADQFQATKPPPFPTGVDACALGAFPNVPHLHIATVGGVVVTTPLNDTDWVITNADGSVFVLSDIEFLKRYHPAPTP